MKRDDISNSFERVVSPLGRIMDSVGRVILASMVLLITSDVVLRYFFNRPIKGSYELVEFMMVILVYLGLAYTQTRKAHVAINLLTVKLSKGRLAVTSSATNFLCTVIFSIITWRCALQAEALRSSGTSSDTLFIPNYPFMWVVVFGSVVLSLIFLKDTIGSLSGVFKHCRRPWLWITLDALFVASLLKIPAWFHMLPWEITRPLMGIIGILLLVLLLFSSMPIGPVMALVGYLGFSYLVNPDASLAILGTSPYRSASSHAMTTIPLFVLMGLLCFYAELSKDVYATIRNWVGRLPGGLAMSTVGGCAGFAAVSGSSMATAVTMGTIALPEMRRYKYSDALACGCVAAGGSIGILIPPSIAFIIYATLTEESIGKLFIAGIIPGLMEAAFYMITIYVMCKMRPSLGPPGPSSTLKEKILSLKDTWGILLLFVLVIGGIYAGVFTPTEAAGVGAFGALLLGIIKRKLNREKILTSLADASKNTAMLLLMLIGADIFSYFLTMSQIPFLLSEFVVGLAVPKAVTIWAILLVYIILGCIMPIIPAIILTIPIFLPVVTGLGYDPIWFGVIVVTMAEMGQITPPVGINVFALSGVAKDVPLGTIFKGILPFLIADLVRVVLVFFIPALALWLPSLMG
ncbi:MAG: TRAP transporter large permease subunit [Deltaproteobacteria bacterium]|nr:TRAP transporter large permease subunit [Deltaproteobacteria bacterium]MBW2136018.1 TRAP transporter large permease subunit [Deltaproteobacteria bacterium]